uniref:Transthyretin-like family protein n=1 Tax=Rhabditophanes sp. KR3021 TaxID=114890 RepID=A0AC35U4Q0_9BILA
MKLLSLTIIGSFVLLATVLADQPKFAENIMTRATAIKGIVYCGTKPHNNAHVYLIRDDSDNLLDILDKKVTGVDGSFTLEGHTAGRQEGESDIHPMVKIFHKCDEPEKKKGFRYFRYKFPRKYVTLGRVARKTYNLGKINLELTYPKETRASEMPVWEPISKE